MNSPCYEHLECWLCEQHFTMLNGDVYQMGPRRLRRAICEPCADHVRRAFLGSRKARKSLFLRRLGKSQEKGGDLKHENNG